MRRNMMDETAAFGFVAAAREYIEPQVNMRPLADLYYLRLVPIATTPNPFTKTVRYVSADIHGRADWINGNSDDIPQAGTSREVAEVSIHTAAIGYGFGWEEIEAAAVEGRQLEADDAFAARRAANEMIQRVAIFGDQRKGFHGLINNPDIVPVAAPNGDWANATEDQILADVNFALTLSQVATDYMAMADTLLLSPERLALAASMRISGTTTTVMQFLQQNNAFTLVTGRPLTIQGVPELKTAGAGSTQRMIAYRRDPEVLRMHLPMPHQFLPVWRRGPLRWEVPGVMRLGGLNIRREAEIDYVDGI